MSASLDLLADRSAGIAVARIAHLVLAVRDCHAAAQFYAALLGLAGAEGEDMLPGCGHHRLLRLPSGQALVLSEQPEQPDLSESGVHHAFRVTVTRREAIRGQLQALGITVCAYKEDRPQEEADNFYFCDPDGNRVQLVAGSGEDALPGIDHACLQVADILWAERFYGAELGWSLDHRVGWRTTDYVRARAWAAGEEDMAPGTRRLDKRYSVMVQRKTVPRANLQLFYRAGRSVIGLYLANKHFQEPPEEQLVGAPRVALAASRDALDRAAERLAAANRPLLGPMLHDAGSPIEVSLYFKDTGGNFLELCVPRHP